MTDYQIYVLIYRERNKEGHLVPLPAPNAERMTLKEELAKVQAEFYAVGAIGRIPREQLDKDWEIEKRKIIDGRSNRPKRRNG